MLKGLFADTSPFTQLIMLIFSMITCCLLFMTIGMLLIPLLLGIPFVELRNIIVNGEMIQHLNLMRYMQILQSINLFIVPAFFAAYLFSRNVTGYLGFRQSVFAKWFGAVFLIMFAAMPCINLLIKLNEMIVFPESLAGLEQYLKDFEESARQTTELFMSVDHAGGLIFNIFMIAILASIGEELIFRGLLQKILTRWMGNVHVAIIVTGFLFSLMHMQFYGFFPRWLLGILFGYLFVWSGTIWIPIFAHFVNNTVTVIILYLIRKGTVSEEMDVFGSSWGDIPVTIVATAICGWLMWGMYRSRKKLIIES